MAFNDVPAECVNVASTYYHIPATLIVSIIKIEHGHNGAANRNPNGTYDYGPLQINSSWLPTLAHYGISQHDLQYNPCINVAVGTWILAQALSESHYLPQGVGNYNSHTPTINQRYSSQVLRWYKYFENKLSSTTS